MVQMSPSDAPVAATTDVLESVAEWFSTLTPEAQARYGFVGHALAVELAIRQKAKILAIQIVCEHMKALTEAGKLDPDAAIAAAHSTLDEFEAEASAAQSFTDQVRAGRPVDANDLLAAIGKRRSMPQQQSGQAGRRAPRPRATRSRSRRHVRGRRTRATSGADDDCGPGEPDGEPSAAAAGEQSATHSGSASDERRRS